MARRGPEGELEGIHGKRRPAIWTPAWQKAERAVTARIDRPSIFLDDSRLTHGYRGCTVLLMIAADRITRNPAVMGGKPCIPYLRVTVGTVAGLVAAGNPQASILKLSPYLEPEDIAAALTYAAWRAEEQEVDLQHE